MVGFSAILRAPVLALSEARGTLFVWVAVFLGVGIGVWFSLPFEPGLMAYAMVGAALALAGLARLSCAEVFHPLCVALGCLCAGFLAAGLRAHLQEAPMLEFRYYGPVQGRIVEIDRSSTDSVRLTLDRVVLDRVAPARTPVAIRIALKGDLRGYVPEPGQVVMTSAHLAAPEGPSEPGGFDFRRMAYFKRLGAVGYAQGPVLLWAPPDPQEQAINRLRTRISSAVMAAIPGDSGAFAAGVMTGDRSGLSLSSVEALRDSSLAHLLAISGMNMAFLVGFVFALVRYGTALVPPVALRINAKKLAAVVAVGVALFYLLLSGANVATERAFVMSMVMLLAVLLDRQALTMRTLAISAVAILLLQPESLLDPGFQMSFAATTALIAGFGLINGQIVREKLPKWMMPVFTLVLSSLLAGFATAPFAAASFNRYAEYGLLANLLTVPVMGAVVMPAGAVAALLAPLGLEVVPFWITQLGCDWILFVARWIASLNGAVVMIPTPAPWVVPMIALGGIWAIAWVGRARLAGIVVMAVAFGLWATGERPDLLISADGSLAGVMGAEGRALSKARGGGFAALTWLENDGDFADQAKAAARPGFEGQKTARQFRIGEMTGLVLAGKDAASRFPAACESFDLVIAPIDLGVPAARCTVVDKVTLRQTGSLAVWHDGNRLTFQPSHRASRIWAPQIPLALNDLVVAPATEWAGLAVSSSGSGPPDGPAP